MQEILNQAISHHQRGEIDSARSLYQEVLRIDQSHADALHLLGITFLQTGQFDECLFYIEKAISIDPDCVAYNNNRGLALHRLKEYEKAIESYDRALSSNPNYVEGYNNKGIALKELQMFAQAIECYDKAISINPNRAETHNNRGIALCELREYTRAIECYARSLIINPNYAEAYYNRGNAYHELSQFNDSIKNYNKAIEVRENYADAYWNKALALLLLGDLKSGFKLYEWRVKVENFSQSRSFNKPLWLGKESLIGKTILLYSEQGFGDTIQFSRYLSKVASLGAKIILEVEKTVVPLLKKIDGVKYIVTKGAPLPEFDYHCSLLSLAYLFDTTLETIPSDIPYLKIDEDKTKKWKMRLSNNKKTRVGIAWSGSATHKRDRYRTISLSKLLDSLPKDYEYICLQTEIRDYDKTTLEDNPQIHFFGDELEDFSDTAALCDLVDLVVTVDTSVAHLAGALGKPTWVLLPFIPDWRWLLERDDSPWYPTMSLFRQKEIDDWNSILTQLRNELESFRK